MGHLICTGITSLDGYVANKDGNFDWSTPDDEVHAFVNDLERSVTTHLLGRRLNEGAGRASARSRRSRGAGYSSRRRILFTAQAIAGNNLRHQYEGAPRARTCATR